ncbi:MAG TPA: bifunctional oligoribonuclease/PAP phosphatase NrnA [Clostridiales bacterium]|nr:bifunctional oligoribonuclease/PAP phosphatase NrnA [Clostridiales bacterium]
MAKCERKSAACLDRIKKTLTEADSILLFPHIHMDGDALGSSVALCIALRQLGKNCSILVNEDIPEYLAFLDNGYCVRETAGTAHVSMAVDCGDASRVEDRKEAFYGAEKTLCIDHHLLHADFAEECYVDPDAAATGIPVFHLIRKLGAAITPEIADALYVAILTDTGSFRYSNADRTTHLLVAELYDYGLNHVPLCNAVYDNIPLSQLRLEAGALESMQLFADGKACIGHLTLEEIQKLGGTPDQTETVIDRLRSIQGVEVAVFLREKGVDTYKASFRSKSYADVGSIAHRLGGGGHRKAAGCTIAAPLEEAIRIVREAVLRELAQ